MSLSGLSDELAQVRTKKKEFLEQIERIVPWGRWIAMIKPCYYKGERGNKPYDLELMLRLYLPSTKNQDKQRDPDAHQVKKGNEWHFGYKAHIGVDKDSGLIHTLKVTAANVHDVTMTSKLLTGEETVVYGDSGYLGAEKREDAIITNHSGKHIRYKINRRPSQMKKGSARSQAQLKRREHEKSSVRAKVEHVFGVVKGLFRYRKTRYRGLRKQTAKLNMLFALANLILADRRCLPA